MATTSIGIRSLQFSDYKAYVFATLFVAGNIIVPQLCHLIPDGGRIFLPIYFFTLVAAYQFGWRVGLMTALLSPLANHLLFDMPPTAMLPIILVKSTFLAFTAAYAAHRAGKVSLTAIAIAVIVAQTAAMPVEWAISGSWNAALGDILVGWPGILIQIIGGWAIIKYVFTSK